VISHDAWIYLVASAFGTVLYDPEPNILYRRHGANVFGIPHGHFDSARYRVRRFLASGRQQIVVRQAEEFRRIFGPSLSEEHRDVLDRFLDSRCGLPQRLLHALTCDLYRQSLLDHLLLKGLMVCNRL
jgi:hypothetical protein